jgi:hypothetical protein
VEGGEGKPAGGSIGEGEEKADEKADNDPDTILARHWPESKVRCEMRWIGWGGRKPSRVHLSSCCVCGSDGCVF